MELDRRIYTRFGCFILPSLTLIFCIAIALFERNNCTVEEQMLADKLDRLSDTYSLLYAEPIATGNTRQIQSYSQALVLDLDIAMFSLRDTSNNVLSDYASQSEISEGFSQTTKVNFSDENGLRKVGTLTIALSKERLDQESWSRIKAELFLLAALLLATLISIVISFQRSIHSSIRQLSHQASHDPLTNLLNRRSFTELLDNAIDTPNKQSTSHCLLFIDLDNFKDVNDSLGHQIGDEALKQVANIIEQHIRHDDIAARLGGDEFAILLNHCPQDKTEIIAESIRTAIQTYGSKLLAANPLSASIGITSIEPGQNTKALLKTVDQACYKAKSAGKNQVHYLPISVPTS